MIRDIFTKEELIFNLDLKSTRALMNISASVNETRLVKSKSKHYFIRPLRHAGFTKRQVNRLGFDCGKKLWRSCMNRRDRHLGGRSRLSLQTLSDIRATMCRLSTFSADRMALCKMYRARDNTRLFKRERDRREETKEEVRYRETTFTEAYSEYVNMRQIDGPPKASFSSFLKVVKAAAIFKKPHRKQLELIEF
jgi:hypothetical protein